MKKIYISIFTLAISFSAMAQLSLESLTFAKGEKSNRSSLMDSEKSAAIWEEDFANGIPVGWTNSAAPWVYRGPGTTPNQNTGTQGAYGTASTTISSPTQANGFIIFDSDYYDNNGTQGNFGNGPYPVPHNGELMTDMIDLTSYSDVTLMAHSYFRTFQGQAFVAFYVNGIYDSQVEVHSNLDVNDATTTDATALIRLPLTVCGNANVQMQFIFDGTSQSNVNGSGYYFWMLDDLELVETPAYLMDVVDQNHGGWDIGYLATSGVGMDYTFKPKVQSDANPYMFEMTIANVGAQPLNGIQMNVEVLNSAGVSVFNSSSSPTTLAVLDTASYLADQTYAPLSQGVYDINFWGASDSILSSDTSEMTAVITDSVYGRDNANPAGAWRVGRVCGGLQLANKFDVYVADEATSVSAYVADYSVVGAEMYAVLYEVDTTGTSTVYIPLDQTDDYTIQPADRDNWVTIGFNQANNLMPGMYMVAIGGYVHPTDTFGINVSGSAEPTMSMIYDDGNGCNLGSQPPPFWYWVTDCPMIRLNFGNPSAGCTDPTALNYNPNATTNDGSCLYCDISFNTPIYQSSSSNTTCDGYIITSATSSYNPITYSWSNGVNGPNNLNLCTGIYTVTATDANGCSISDTFTIGQIIYGCMYPLASNYNPSANMDDGSCCIDGCTDSIAFNYNSSATCDDGSCIAVVNGCTDANASNYDILANIDDGSCYYCDVSISLTAFQDPTPGYCNGLIISSATSSYSSVTYSWNTGSTSNVITSLCAGIYELTATDSLGCSATQIYYLGTIIYGCTDPLATNYDPTANADNGSCIYLSFCNEDSPTGLFASNIIHNRATINWDNMNSPVCSVDQYRIRYREAGPSSWSTKTMSGPVGSCNFASQKTDKLILNLTANTNYEYQMKAWYCGGGASSWSGIETFTTLDNCPNVGNLAVYGATPTKATFTWDASNGVYSFVRLKARVDSISNPTGTDFFQIGGAGVSYGTFTKNKNNLTPGETYRGQARTYCDPNGGGWKSLSWTPLVYWTQPTLRIEGGDAISHLAIYPNPSKDVFNVTFTSERVQDLRVRVLNVVGEEIIKEELQQYIGEYTKQINLEDNAKGIFFLEIETNDGIINKKLVLQ